MAKVTCFLNMHPQGAKHGAASTTAAKLSLLPETFLGSSFGADNRTG